MSRLSSSVAGLGGVRGRFRLRFPWVIAGLLVIGVAAGLILSGLLPRRGTPTAPPIQVTVMPEASGTSVAVMPDLRGLSAHDARQVLADAGLSSVPVKIVEVPYFGRDGYVVDQEPIIGEPSPTSATLYLGVPGKVPAVVGQTEDEAKQALARLGVTVDVVRKYTPGKSPGTVLASAPAAGDALTASVALTVVAIPQTRYLNDIGSEGGCAADAAVVNGTKLPESVVCRASDDPRTTVWLLSRKTATLTATVGLEDGTDPDAKVTVSILGDGKQLFAADLGYGKSIPLEISTAGVLRLELVVTRSDDGRDSSLVVLGDAVVSGSAEDLAALGDR